MYTYTYNADYTNKTAFFYRLSDVVDFVFRNMNISATLTITGHGSIVLPFIDSIKPDVVKNVKTQVESELLTMENAGRLDGFQFFGGIINIIDSGKKDHEDVLYTKEEIAQITKVIDMVIKTCDTTECGECPFWDGRECRFSGSSPLDWFNR